MQVAMLERDGVKIVECVEVIARPGDAIDLVAACLEHGSTRLLLESEKLPPGFFDLRSGLAGELLQKLENYQIRSAGVFPPEGDYTDRFREFLSEAKRGRSFRVFATRGEAEVWLAAG